MNCVCIYQSIVVGLKFIRLILLKWMGLRPSRGRSLTGLATSTGWWPCGGMACSPGVWGRESSNALKLLYAVETGMSCGVFGFSGSCGSSPNCAHFRWFATNL